MEQMKLIIVAIVVFATVITSGYLISRSVKDYEIIEPEKGVRCIVVSRMYNTSVDCWKTNASL